MSTDNLNTQALALGGLIQSETTVDGGNLKNDVDVLELQGALPEGVTAEQYKAVQKQQLINAQAIEFAAGTVGIEHFANNAEGDKVTGKFKVGNQHYNVTVQRKKEVDTSAPGATEPKWETRHGVVSGGYQTTTTAEHKRLREHLFKTGNDRLGK